MTETELIVALREVHKEWQAGTEAQIEVTLRYASLLLDARRRHPSNQEFALWLAAKDLDELSKDDRAALLSIAEHPDLYRDVRATSRRDSLRLIWLEEMQPRLRNAAKTEVTSPTVSTEHPPAEETPDSPAPEPGISGRGKSARATASRSPLKDFPQAALVLEHVRSGDTRSMLMGLMKKRTGRAIWDLLVESIKTGAFGPPTETAATTPNLRLILPWAPSTYARRVNLLDRDAVAGIRENLMPVVLANRDTLFRQPDQLVPLLTVASDLKYQAARTSRQAEKVSRQQAAVAALPSTETEIVMYGQTVWPHPHGRSTWSYRELQEACWFYRVVAPILEAVAIQRKQEHCAQEVRQHINHMMKWLPLRGTPFADAVRHLGLAYEANSTGECRVPPPPPNFGLF